MAVCLLSFGVQVRVKPYKLYPPLNLKETSKVLGSPQGKTGWNPILDEHCTWDLIDAFRDNARK